MLSIRLDPVIERRLSKLAKQTGRTMSFYARELIERNFEDIEDRYLAEARIEKRRPSLASREVRKLLRITSKVPPDLRQTNRDKQQESP